MDVKDESEKARRCTEIERSQGLLSTDKTLGEKFWDDAMQLNQALGGCIVFMDSLIGPRELLDRIEARMDAPVRNLSLISQQIFRDVKPQNLDRRWRRG